MFIASVTSLALSTNFAVQVTTWLTLSGFSWTTKSASVPGVLFALTTVSLMQICWMLCRSERFNYRATE